MPGALSPAARVLRLLLAAEGPCSGEDMGRELGVSRAAVSKLVAGLRQQGFKIDSKPRAGYQLVSEPDAPTAARVEARLSDGGLGAPLIYAETIDSTNLEARRRAEAGAEHGTCVTADFQEAGRGRLDRRWEAPSGSCLLFSVILRPELAIYQVFGLTLLTSLAACRAIEETSDLKPQIKWPNDLYLDGRKLAGVLTEFASRAEAVEHVVVGVGINVNLAADQLKGLGQPAASLSKASGTEWDRAALLAGILNHLSDLYRDFEDNGIEAVRAEYDQRFMLAGRPVQAMDGQKVIKGTARGIDADGALLLELADGSTTVIRHGDVSLRPAD